MLFVVDIEGCIMPARRGPVDLSAIGHLRAVLGEMRAGAHGGHGAHGAGRAARDAWAFTICTGRPAPYVEAVLQLVGGPWPGVPAVVEHGAFLYDALTGTMTPHPALADQREVLDWAQEAVADFLGSERCVGAQREPGKELCVSINPPPGMGIAAFFHEVAAALEPVARHLTIMHSQSSVDITPRGIDKGTGLSFLCEHIGVELASCVAIGDSQNDLPMLRRAGHPAAPRNADPDALRVAEYVSPLPEALGVADIIQHYRGQRAVAGTAASEAAPARD